MLILGSVFCEKKYHPTYRVRSYCRPLPPDPKLNLQRLLAKALRKKVPCVHKSLAEKSTTRATRTPGAKNSTLDQGRGATIRSGTICWMVLFFAKHGVEVEYKKYVFRGV